MSSQIDKALAQSLQIIEPGFANKQTCLETAKWMAGSLGMHTAADLPADALERTSPRYILAAMISRASTPEWREERALLDLKSCTILLAERLFKPNELSEILEGRRTLRELNKGV